MIKAIFLILTEHWSPIVQKRWNQQNKQLNMLGKTAFYACSNGRSPVKIKEIIDELELDMYVVYNGQLVLLQIARLSTTLLNKKYWNILLNLQMRTIDKSFWCEKSVRWINDDAIRTIDFIKRLVSFYRVNSRYV